MSGRGVSAALMAVCGRLDVPRTAAGLVGSVKSGTSARSEMIGMMIRRHTMLRLCACVDERVGGVLRVLALLRPRSLTCRLARGSTSG
eukprot:1450481-Prymnesium_polylepis.2